MTKRTPIHHLFLRFLPVIILVAVLAVFTGSVSSCNEPVAGDSTAVSSGHGDATREELLAIIEGGWVNADYQEALLRVHSPMFAAEAGRPVQEMMFNTANLNGDTVMNESGRLNYLDGERFDVVLFKEGAHERMQIWQGAAYAEKPLYLDYRIHAEDTMLCIVNPATNDTTWYKREFRKAPVKAGVAHNALEHYVNRALFAGEWEAQDGSTVSFSADGTVSGWAKWTWFSVEIDKYGTEIQPDVMSAYNDKMGATYVYTLDNDRLSIYEYDSNTDDEVWTRGQLVAEFERKK